MGLIQWPIHARGFSYSYCHQSDNSSQSFCRIGHTSSRRTWISMCNIPSKDEREGYEIREFLGAYSKIKKIDFTILKKLDDEVGESLPDYLIRDTQSNEEIIVELTSVYLNDRSFIDRHFKEGTGIDKIPVQKDDINAYKERVLEQIKRKSKKALKYPLNDRKLVLSIYLNEYESLCIRKEAWVDYLKNHIETIDNLSPINEVLLWNSKPGWEEPEKTEYESVLVIING